MPEFFAFLAIYCLVMSIVDIFKGEGGLFCAHLVIMMISVAIAYSL